VDGRRFCHISERADVEECNEAIKEILEEIHRWEMRRVDGAGIPRLKAQIACLEERKLVPLRRELDMIEFYIVQAFEQGREAHDCSAMRLTAHERKMAETMANQGYRVLRNGWPDFLAIRGSVAVGIEVKRPRERLHERQSKMHLALEQAGIPVIVARSVKNLKRRLSGEQ
jgi:hypothetical protein